MTWGGSNAKPASAAWGCLFSLFVTIVKASLLNLIFRPLCPLHGKISKLEIIRHQGRIPGVFLLWGLFALLGGPFVIATVIAFLLTFGQRR